jgi:hypothetical protein
MKNALNHKYENTEITRSPADISYIAGEMKYFSGNSRADVLEFIYLAKDFQKSHSKTNWNEIDYR